MQDACNWRQVACRPLVLGQRKRAGKKEYCIASEDCAFGPIGFERVRDVRAGEMLVITPEVHHHINPCPAHYYKALTGIDTSAVVLTYVLSMPHCEGISCSQSIGALTFLIEAERKAVQMAAHPMPMLMCFFSKLPSAARGRVWNTKQDMSHWRLHGAGHYECKHVSAGRECASICVLEDVICCAIARVDMIGFIHGH